MPEQIHKMKQRGYLWSNSPKFQMSNVMSIKTVQSTNETFA